MAGSSRRGGELGLRRHISAEVLSAVARDAEAIPLNLTGIPLCGLTILSFG
jgi:hypothetical protein